MDHDLEATPLQILTNIARVGDGEKVSLNVQNIGQIVIDFGWKYRGFHIQSCGSHLFPTHELVEGTKIWTISRTKKALSLLSNDVEVLNLVFAELTESCVKTWSVGSTKITFATDDLASDYKRTLIKGMAPYLIVTIIKKLYCLTKKH